MEDQNLEWTCNPVYNLRPLPHRLQQNQCDVQIFLDNAATESPTRRELRQRSTSPSNQDDDTSSTTSSDRFESESYCELNIPQSTDNWYRGDNSSTRAIHQRPGTFVAPRNQHLFDTEIQERQPPGSITVPQYQQGRQAPFSNSLPHYQPGMALATTQIQGRQIPQYQQGSALADIVFSQSYDQAALPQYSRPASSTTENLLQHQRILGLSSLSHDEIGSSVRNTVTLPHTVKTVQSYVSEGRPIFSQMQTQPSLTTLHFGCENGMNVANTKQEYNSTNEFLGCKRSRDGLNDDTYCMNQNQNIRRHANILPSYGHVDKDQTLKKETLPIVTFNQQYTPRQIEIMRYTIQEYEAEQEQLKRTAINHNAGLVQQEAYPASRHHTIQGTNGATQNQAMMNENLLDPMLQNSRQNESITANGEGVISSKESRQNVNYSSSPPRQSMIPSHFTWAYNSQEQGATLGNDMTQNIQQRHTYPRDTSYPQSMQLLNDRPNFQQREPSSIYMKGEKAANPGVIGRQNMFSMNAVIHPYKNEQREASNRKLENPQSYHKSTDIPGQNDGKPRHQFGNSMAYTPQNKGVVSGYDREYLTPQHHYSRDVPQRDEEYLLRYGNGQVPALPTHRPIDETWRASEIKSQDDQIPIDLSVKRPFQNSTIMNSVLSATPHLTHTHSQAMEQRQNARDERWSQEKGPKFNGKGNFDDFIVQFDCIASIRGWSDKFKGESLLLSLEGQAAGVIGTLPSDLRTNYEALKSALMKRFSPKLDHDIAGTILQNRRRKKGESHISFAQELKKLANSAYESFPTECLERITREKFFSAIEDPNMRGMLWSKSPNTLEEAAIMADGLEKLLETSNAETPYASRSFGYQHETGQSNRRDRDQRNRRSNGRNDEDRHQGNNHQQQGHGQGQAVQQGSKDPNSGHQGSSRSYRPANGARCYRCDNIGHFARNCPYKFKDEASVNANDKNGQQNGDNRQGN